MNTENTEPQASIPSEIPAAEAAAEQPADAPAPRARRTRSRKAAETVGDVFDAAIADREAERLAAEAQAQQALQHGEHAHQGNGHAGNGQAEAEPYKPKWVDRYPEWVDDQAGVKLRQDRKNNLSVISFRERPSAEVVALLEEHGYENDEGEYAKRVSKLRPGQSHEEAQNLAFEAANMVRAENGMPEKKGFYVSRG